ncbi:hypothetical protein KIN20_005707 [Parelaphostrongylus tenuis]|uniref:Uncharacterized protein n=1 Tax=Parelaphostrongylus tenuis TaxID=148309 RepID=A0AAD5MLI4_PARTN|nr:hypothetical protein KIN20_005707 [Parelaphostrongylus tenuis]
MKTTVDAIQNPTRRSLTSHFDWRPFVKRAGAERRIAEVNGMNAFTVTFDRSSKSDVISTKPEEAVFAYDVYGQWRIEINHSGCSRGHGSSLSTSEPRCSIRFIGQEE